jgi:hypothetical protein
MRRFRRLRFLDFPAVNFASLQRVYPHPLQGDTLSHRGRPPARNTKSENGNTKGEKFMSEAGALELQVNQQIIVAMKAHDAERTTTLRLIKNALKN